jgi:hypothetical protein
MIPPTLLGVLPVAQWLMHQLLSNLPLNESYLVTIIKHHRTTMKVNKNTTISVRKKTMMMMPPLAKVATAIDANDISTANINNNYNISGIRRASVTNTTINPMLVAAICAEAYENRSNNIAVLLAMGIGPQKAIIVSFRLQRKYWRN